MSTPDPSNAPRFLTPAELCDRWRVDMRTLDKFALPWFTPSPRVRRLELEVVEAFERRNRLQVYQTTSSQPADLDAH